MYKVMIVEDEKIIRAGLRKIIEQMDAYYTVSQECSDGIQAWELFQRNMPDLVITDIRMKSMSGLELITKIREANSDIPIIIVSGYSDFEYAKKALRLQVRDYLLKPISVKELTGILLKLKEVLDGMAGADAEPSSVQMTEQSSVIGQVKEYVKQHIGDSLSLQYLADHVNISPNYLSTLFKNETGQNISDYITDQRIKKAKSLLCTTNLKIYDVSGLCGYTSPKHFMDVFKKTVGETPMQYRNKAQSNKM